MPGPDERAYRCYAKVNLILRVVRKRPDGYHDIDSLMQTVDLADTVTLRWGGPGLTVGCSEASLGGESNLAWKAAKRFFEATGIEGRVDIFVSKRIPVAAGLGGGSSDAACVLNALASYHGISPASGLVAALALEVGSDVPYLLKGGPARVRGRGEIVEPAAPAVRRLMGALDLVAATPPVAVRSSWAYGQLKMELTGAGERDSILSLDSAIADRTNLAGALRNDLEEAVAGGFPIVGSLKARMMELGALGAVMSGSGPTVLAIVEGRAQAEQMAERLAAEGHRAFALRATGSAHSACD